MLLLKLQDIVKAKNPYSGEIINLFNFKQVFQLIVGAGLIGLFFKYGSMLADKAQGYLPKGMPTGEAQGPIKRVLN